MNRRKPPGYQCPPKMPTAPGMMTPPPDFCPPPDMMPPISPERDMMPPKPSVPESMCFQLAHAYVPWQHYTPPFFSPVEALEKGTMFPDLYQPYVHHKEKR